MQVLLTVRDGCFRRTRDGKAVRVCSATIVRNGRGRSVAIPVVKVAMPCAGVSCLNTITIALREAASIARRIEPSLCFWCRWASFVIAWTILVPWRSTSFGSICPQTRPACADSAWFRISKRRGIVWAVGEIACGLYGLYGVRNRWWCK